MSTARAATHPTARDGRSRQPVLRLVPGVSSSPKAPFATLVVIVLALGLLGLLVLNTALREGAITLSDLDADTARLRDQVTELSEEAAARQAPGSLADRAGELGMKPAEDPIFLDVPPAAQGDGP